MLADLIHRSDASAVANANAANECSSGLAKLALADTEAQKNDPWGWWRETRPDGSTIDLVSDLSEAELRLQRGRVDRISAQRYPAVPAGHSPARARILDWLDAIGEKDPETVQNFVNAAAADPAVRAHFLRLAGTV